MNKLIKDMGWLAGFIVAYHLFYFLWMTFFNVAGVAN